MRAVGYFRVSSEDQIEGWSLDAQKLAFQEFCRSRGWEIAGYYPDEGKSAWTDSINKRPKFKKMLEDAKEKKFDVVVTHTLDRFSRNLWVMLESFRVFADYQVMFVSIQEQIDYTKPEGRLFLMMLGAFAQYYSDALSGHVRKGMKQRAISGLYNGEPPFGYERCTEDCQSQGGHGGAHVVDWKAELVRELFSRYAGGTVSCKELAQWLNEQGARTNNRKTFVGADGRTLSGPQLFTSYAVRDLLHNQFYLGKVRYRGQYYDGLHEPMVDEKLFDEVQKRLARNRSHTNGLSKARRHYLLQGLARCVYCGFPMWADAGGRGVVPRYRERPGLTMSPCEAGDRSVRADEVDPQAELVFTHLVLRPGWREWVIERLQARAKVKSMKREKAKLEAKLRRLLDVYTEGDISKAEYRRRKREVQEKMDALTIPEVDAAATAAELLENSGKLWEAATVKQRNKMLTAMLEAVLIDPVAKKVVGIVPRPAFRDLFLCLEENGTVKIYEPDAFLAQVSNGNNSKNWGLFQLWDVKR